MIRFNVRGGPVKMAVSSRPVSFRVGEAVTVLTGGTLYAGPYEVTPLAEKQQTLFTKNLLMKEDVLVLPVPYYEVDNQDGTTIFIASEV